MTQPRFLFDSLLLSAAAVPDKVAVVAQGISYSYKELLEQSRCLAAALQQHGLKPGDRVVIYLGNSWECAVAIFGVLLAGGVFVVVDSQTKRNKLQLILSDCDTKIMITNSLHSDVFVPLLKGFQSVICSGKELDPDLVKAKEKNGIQFEQFDQIISRVPRTLQEMDFTPLELSALIYTSGTTGRPKGVMQTHQAMVFTVGSVIESLGLSSNDRIFSVLPLSFSYGLYQLLMSVQLGATLILEQSFTYPAQVYQRMKEQKITIFPGVPTIFSKLITSHKKKGLRFDSVKGVTSAASALPSSFIPYLHEIFPNSKIYHMYGLTECKRVSCLDPELIDKKPRSVGKAIPGTQTFLLNPNGKPAQPGEKGILYVRGPHVMRGYWKKSKLSAKMLKEFPGSLTNERVLCTQDWFTQDAEGYLYFQGRSDDIIMSRGEKVSPVEVEDVLISIKGIREAAVIGIADKELGESICAFVSVDQAADLSEKKIMRNCFTRLDHSMIPKKIVFLDDLPKIVNGKVDKKALNAMVPD